MYKKFKDYSDKEQTVLLLKGHTVRVTEEGSEFWYLNNGFHREDGPAIMYEDGNVQWWLNDIIYSKAEHDILKKVEHSERIK